MPGKTEETGETAGPYTPQTPVPQARKPQARRPQARKTLKAPPLRHLQPAKLWVFSSAATPTCLWTTHQPRPKTRQASPQASHKARVLLAQARVAQALLPPTLLAPTLLARALLARPRPLVPALSLSRRPFPCRRPPPCPLWPLRRFRSCPAMARQLVLWAKCNHNLPKHNCAKSSKMQKESASDKRNARPHGLQKTPKAPGQKLHPPRPNAPQHTPPRPCRP